MRQMLVNAKAPTAWEYWPKHDANWAIAGGAFVATCDGTASYIGQDIGDLKIGDVLTLKHNVTQASMDGALKLSGAGAFGSVTLGGTVALHETEVTVSNAIPTYDLYMAMTGGTTGTITIDLIELWKDGEMIVNSEGMPSAWGW